MKKNISLVLCIIICFKSFCQADTANSIPVKPATDYSALLKKSKDQKNTAWVMLGAGTAMAVTGIIFWANEEERNRKEYDANSNNNSGGWLYIDLGYTYQLNGWLVLSGLGITTAILSAPVFHAARKNKQAAKKISASLKMERASVIQGVNMTKVNYPALSFSMNL